MRTGESCPICGMRESERSLLKHLDMFHSQNKVGRKKLLVKFRACNDIEHHSGLQSQCLFYNWGRGCNLQLKTCCIQEELFNTCPFKDGRTLEITPMMEE